MEIKNFQNKKFSLLYFFSKTHNNNNNNNNKFNGDVVDHDYLTEVVPTYSVLEGLGK